MDRIENTGVKTSKRVRAILSISMRSRRAQVAETFVSTRYGLYKRIATRVIRGSKSTYGFLASQSEAEDIAQEIAFDEYQLLADGTSGPAPVLDWVDKWQAVIVKRGSRISAQHLRASEHTGIAESETAMRRLREIQKTRSILYRSGEDAERLSEEEIVAATNKRLAEASPNYRRQGMECSIEDIYLTSISTQRPWARDGDCASEFAETAAPAFSTPETNPDDSLLGVTGAERLIADIIARCHSISTLHGKVAQAWIGAALPYGDIQGVKEISDGLRLETYLVEKMMIDVRGEAVISASLTAGISSYEFLGLKGAAKRREYA